ncbi:hypothetical protein HYS31_05265 [Candidatus Woesearchaeota archaeon]|nr:hypothetical protein [Candidatus Woesearchaeota archaeon]
MNYANSSHSNYNGVYYRLKNLYNDLKELLQTQLPKLHGLELALASSDGYTIKIDDSVYQEPAIRSPEHTYFAKHGGKLHKHGHTVVAPRSNSFATSVDLDYKPDGMTATQYLIQKLRINPKQARKALKRFGQKH